MSLWHDALTDFPKENGYIIAILQGCNTGRTREMKIYYTKDEDDCDYKATAYCELANVWNVLVWRKLDSEDKEKKNE